jgi:hypothetical protein
VNIAYQQPEETPEFYRKRYEELKAQAAGHECPPGTHRRQATTRQSFPNL